MYFVVGTVENFELHGFEPTVGWRTSVDNTQAIAHIEYVRLLVPDIETNIDFTIYTAPSTELTTLLASAEWTVPE